MLTSLSFLNKSLRASARKDSTSFLNSFLALACVFLFGIYDARSEGSGTWKVTANYQANLMVPTVTTISGDYGGGNTGYRDRGFMMLPSDIDDLSSTTVNSAAKQAYKSAYKSDHRLFVWVKAGETVFFGFHQNGSGTHNTVFNWYYENNTTSGLGYFPSATQTTATGRKLAYASPSFNIRGTGNTQGRPDNATEAQNGPTEIAGNSGYQSLSFKNETGHDRAFWLEVSFSNQTQGSNNTPYREFDFWDITVASGSPGNYNVKKGRVYCKYWSLVNALPSTAGSANNQSFPSDFGFHIPIDNEYTTANDFFVKYANFGNSNAGYVVFFANSDGPGTTGSFADKRKSKVGTSNSHKYPLFLNNPDETVWPSALLPEWDYSAVFSKRTDSQTGGQGKFSVTVNTPCVVDILIDLNNDQIKNGTDVLLSHEFTAAGTQVIEWNGKDAAGNDVPAGTNIHFVSSLAFFPVHFPIYDMEQSLGISIKHMRPIRGGGSPIDDVLYWDDSNISGTAIDPKVNTTGISGRKHRWNANGDNGFSNENTVNTWTGAFNERVTRNITFQYDVDVDLAVVKSVTPGTATAWQNVTFTIEAENLAIEGQTDVTATGVEVVDILPDGYWLVDIQVPAGTSWNALENKWIIGNLPVGEKKVMTIIAQVTPFGPYLNTALIQGNENDINEENNKDDATIQTFKIFGNVFHDPDGGFVDNSTGGANQIPSNMWVSLVASDDKVITSIPLSSNGAYSFTSIPGNYRVAMEGTKGVEGQPLVTFVPPTSWLVTGSFNGSPNTGNSGNISGASELFELTDQDVYNINFGIQQPPVTQGADHILPEIPYSGSTLPLNHTVESTSGYLDQPEASDADGTLSTLIVTTPATGIFPAGGRANSALAGSEPVLLYDGIPVTVNLPISNFDPAKFSFKLNGLGYNGVFFQFKVTDNAGAESGISTYTVRWGGSLPVKWVSVKVKEENSNAIISWTTADEVNVASFDLQYSADARDWQTIKTVKATNQSTARYQASHLMTGSHVHYYRVQSLDHDGSISRSEIVSLKGMKSSPLQVYPNPVGNGELTVKADLTRSTSIKVFSLAGIEMKSVKLTGSVLNVSSLPAGQYILQVNFGSGEARTQSFIVR